MKNVTYPLLLAAVCSLATTEVVNAASLFKETVFCGAKECGTMTINTYEAFESTTEDGINVGGVTIEGNFDPIKSGNFRYIQAIIVDDVPIPFTDGTDLSIPYIDTPPGGYLGQPFDFLPYYDEEGEFPGFFDRPDNPLAYATDTNYTGPDGKVNVQFETWLVNVVDETLGVNLNQAQDDAFTVAPLIGWTWGFSNEYINDGDANPNELEDFTTVADPFNFIKGAPSADWQTALGNVYGTAPNQDKFNVAVVPEPSSTLGLLAFSALSTAFLLKRQKNRQKSAARRYQ